MLTDKEKERIILEEKYRSEVRTKLEDKELKPNKFLAFFNSNLGIFLLSAFFITGLGKLYEIHESNILEEQKFNRLNSELVHRLNTLQNISDTMFMYQAKDVDLAFKGNAIASKLNVESYNFRSVYSEYASWSCLRLIEQLLEIENSRKLKELHTLLKKNTFAFDHLSENWFDKLDSIYLPYRQKFINKGNVNPHEIKWDYYLDKSLYSHISKNRPIRLFLINQTDDIKDLVEAIKNY